MNWKLNFLLICKILNTRFKTFFFVCTIRSRTWFDFWSTFWPTLEIRFFYELIRTRTMKNSGNLNTKMAFPANRNMQLQFFCTQMTTPGTQSKNAVSSNIKHCRYIHLMSDFLLIHFHTKRLYVYVYMFDIVDTQFSYGRGLIVSSSLREFPRQKKVLCMWSEM